MTPRSLLAAGALSLLAGGAAARPIADPDTRAWWQTTRFLASDAMEGRDTGSAGYERAARYVADRFRRAGLVPAGDNGTYFQRVNLTDVRVEKAGTWFEVAPLAGGGAGRPLRFLRDITVRPTDRLPPRLDAPLVFRGYCSKEEMTDVAGKLVVCFNVRRTAGGRNAAALAAGAAGLIAVDNPYFTVEPPRWPVAYARTVRIEGSRPLADAALPAMRLNAEAFAALISGSGRDPAAILAAGGKDSPLPAFDIPARLRAAFALRSSRYSSPNVLAVLPGTDLKDQYVVLGAHLDGYGYGEPVKGDGLYNGALDDAAYVALLARLADRRQGRPFRRSILFAAFTGEEKGLLGSTFFTAHPTVPVGKMAAMINLDQLRPLFPLDILTMLAVNDTSLGDIARAVAAPMGIRIQPDPEPERGLLQRADHWPFLQIGVPATGFIFGYVPGTEAERRYRLWYRTRYHHPADDVTQPMDFEAAAKFNAFFYRLVESVADTTARPRFLGSSP